MRLSDQIQKTEERYAERTGVREGRKKSLVGENLLAVNKPELVHERMRRLGVDGSKTDLSALGALESLSADLSEGQTIALERIINQNDLMPYSFLEHGAEVGRSIGRIHVISDEGSGFGTGFLISNRLLMTNHHVFAKVADATDSSVEFNYQKGNDGKLLPKVTFTFEPEACFITDEHLDVTIVAVREKSNNGRQLAEFGFLPLLASPGKVLLGEFVNIIQHPSGEPKQVALRANQITDLLDDFLHYETDTAPGSSGSSVCNDQWELVALHHSGVPRRDIAGKIMTKSGKPFVDGMPEDDIEWVANEGVRISRIVEFLRSQKADGKAKQLIDAALSASGQSTTPNGTPSTPVKETRVPGVSQKPLGAPPKPVMTHEPTINMQTPTDGVVVTIPLQITIRVGEPATTQGPVINLGSTDSSTASVATSELSAALAAFKESATRPYYQQQADQDARDTYYADIDAQVSPAKLFKTLSKLLEQSHTTQPTYKPAKELYPWIDLQENRKIRSIYSLLEFDPEELIRADFEIDHRRELLRERLTAEKLISHERFDESVDMLEAMMPYNCEHVVCQSWFSKAEPMRGDLHHLFACEMGCNSFRGNQHYFQFSPVDEVVRSDCGRREEDRFEPGAGKGAVARATLYFLLRYPGVINEVSEEYDEDLLNVLVQWHKAESVSKYERHRNAAIFERQGNRNPLIDHPEWATRIKFTDGL